MPLDPTTAAKWLQEGPPVVFFRNADDYAAAGDDITLANWRFTKGKTWLKRIAKERRMQAVKELLISDFSTATPQVKAIARAAWQESDETQVLAKVCDVLDNLRDNFSSFSGASKQWLIAWANKRGVKRAGEAD